MAFPGGMTRRKGFLAGAGLLTLATIAIPVVAQRGPTSLLPPGFDEPIDEPDVEEPSAPSAPGPSTSAPNVPATPPPGLSLSDLGLAPVESLAGNTIDLPQLTPEELAAQQAKFDLPEGARRSLARIGPLTDATGGFAPTAFGTSSGQYLAALMRKTRAPFVSRWGSILLRRVLLSATDTPRDINGADYAAERAWLLVRMGEADAARMMVQSVDSDQYTPRLQAVAMQTYLATGDLAGLCPIQYAAQRKSRTPGWKMVGAICASYSGEQGTASATLNQARHNGVTGIDYRLTEKMVGAGVNSRRSVKIEWEGVNTLTAWRFGLATAANVPIPAPLMNQGGARVRAWQARAPMLSLTARLPSVETAARLGVFSSGALVAFYAALADSEETQPKGFDRWAERLRTAYAAGDDATRVGSMRDLWTGANGLSYVGLLASARAAATIAPYDAAGEDVDNLIAAMMSAGYDISAGRWAAHAQTPGEGSGLGWALLAVGAPRPAVNISTSTATQFADANGHRGQMLVAALAGLGRLDLREAASIADDADISYAPNSRWSRAIAQAAQRRERGTVALLAAIGMQTGAWSAMPAAHLFHVVSALRKVGLDPEARMIAAEAITRS